MTRYTVTGMSCAACSARVEKAVIKVPGVTQCSVSLLTNSMTVEGDAAAEKVIEAVTAAGYGAAPVSGSPTGQGGKRIPAGKNISTEERNGLFEDKQTSVLKKRLIVSAVLLLPLMYVSMGGGMFGWPLPAFLEENPLSKALMQMLLAGAVMVVNQRFFLSGFRSFVNRAPNMDALVSMGSGVSFVYSICTVFSLSASVYRQDMETAAECMKNLYFESAAMILVLISVGKLLEARAKGKTTDALKNLIRLRPEKIMILEDGEETEKDIDEARPGDLFVVRSGETVSADGIILEGTCAVDESMLTGESLPVDKQQGDRVNAATMVRSGHAVCRVTGTGEDTALARIIQMVSDATAAKAPLARIADKVSGIFVPVVIGIALITFILWKLDGQTWGFALARGISVLVISCPCALGLATPAAIMVGSGLAARHGILFKTASALEMTGKCTVAALDKTGTLTAGVPEITDVVCVGNMDREMLLRLALTLEIHSSHPLAEAVVKKAKESGILPFDSDSYAEHPGGGVSCNAEGKLLCGGNEAFITAGGEKIPASLKAAADGLAEQGKTPLFFSVDGKTAGLLAAADTLRGTSLQAVRELKQMGLKVIMITGDNKKTAEALGKSAGVDRTESGVRPEGKAELIGDLKKEGPVIMVGDGINDAPALTGADIGMAIGAGTDVAVDAAQVVLMRSDPLDIPAAVRLSRRTLKTIRQNLFWAFFYNAVCIPVAAGVWYKAFGITLSPMLCAAAMSLSSFCVISNALRLNLFDMYKDSDKNKTKHGTENDKDNDKDNDKENDKEYNTEYNTNSNSENDSENNTKSDTKSDTKSNTKKNTNSNSENNSENNINNKTPKKEILNMKKTIVIEGMHCGHCSGAVKKALLAMEGVKTAEVSHETGLAEVEYEGDIPEESFRKAVEDQDFKVTQFR